MTATVLKTRDEFSAAIAPLESWRSIEYPIDGWSFALNDEERVVARVDDLELPVTSTAMEQALGKVPGLTKAAVTQWPQEMLLDTVNWFYEHGDGDARALTYQDKIVSFTKSTAPLVPVSQVLEDMEQSLTSAGADVSDLHFGAVRVSMDRVTCGLVLANMTQEPKVGDVVQAGIWLHHSPTSARASEISPYVNRLVCTNGMISGRSLQKWNWRGGTADADAYSRWIRTATAMSFEGLQTEFDGLKALTQQPLNGHASVVVEDIFERHHVPAGLRESILEALVDEADGTMYGIAQAFNRAANLAEDPMQMRNLLLVTGDVVAQSERCNSCFRSL